jgi:hypothetical protein
MPHIHPQANLIVQAVNALDLNESALQRREDALDEALRLSFPASDPVAVGIDIVMCGTERNGQVWWKQQMESDTETRR